MTLRRPDKTTDLANPLLEWSFAGTHEVLKEETFKRMIAVERKRTERSREPFLLMLLEAGNHQSLERSGKALDSILSVLPMSIRETDVIGWYTDRSAVGVMFTGLSCNDKDSILSVILNKVSTTLRDQLTSDQFNQVSISFHFFPDDWDQDKPGRPSNPSLYPDLLIPNKDRCSLLRVKHVMDFVGSGLLLLLCTPLFLVIALAIKTSSKGPVLFRQQRVGQYGRCFTFLKFRSMHADNDHRVHKEYAIKLIAGDVEHKPSNGNDKSVYKLANDPRITRLGKFLRRTSLDELPQLVNVLKGDMSLVGPRPAIPYELAAYQTWHRRRVLEVKPGITGLWQVTGRSSVKFDEMVRLDLRYATSWSPWLDIKILMRTPRAVIGGAGAR
ncbi:sugar transferase [Tunturiibacter psychrotolerans]|uniref:sugar transferase n=1 Tax=Tunturiibacter psychrotolerans TaxID=3069686 RepID=UPI003D1D4EC2